uniref:DNA replication fork stabilization factor DONSON n=1 Tax=Amphiprion percula TaxID=161767 RepID=A0A3P8SWL3_AMPPE
MVISQTGYSPSFKRPAEIMRMRRKRARSDAGVFSSPSGQSSADSPGQSGSSPACVRPFSPGPLFNTQNRAGGGIKRRNPFANIENTFTQITAEPLDQPPLSFKSYQICVFSMSRIDPNTLCTEYPADWSLKTRLLFTSPLTLSWAEQPKAQEEALGLSQHCRAQFSSLPHSVQDPKSCSELRCAFQQSLVYWQHPSLPWLSMFPRINAERSFTGKSTPWAQDATLQQSLMREWSVSLSSLYSLLKSRLCPYFYLCSYQFTALFRAAGLGGSDNITALISPTTRGFREAMKAEGIEFSLPLVEERKKSRECCDLNEDADCQTHDDEDGSFSWLKEMGVQDKIKKPDGITIQLRKEGHAVSLDHKPESVVCVEGSHTFTLINFLINCKSVVAAAGSQAGLPPTLLAPVAFRGATMHTLKVTGGSVDLSGCGLHPSSIQQLQQPSGLGKTALTHISMKNYSYTWKN